MNKCPTGGRVKSKEIVEEVTKLLTPEFLADLDLWDVEYVKEGKSLYLRVYIDKEGGVSTDDLERVSRFLSEKLDELDFIKDPYMLELSSPGINRVLKRDSDFLRYLGDVVDVKLYKPFESIGKEFDGILKNYENNTITIEVNKKSYEFNKEDVASCRLAVFF